MKRNLLAVIAYSSAITVFSADAPFDFKGVTLGAPVTASDLNDRFNSNCAETAPSCYFQTTLAGADASVLVTIKEGKLTAVTASFSPDHFEDVKKAAESKFGKPVEQSTNPVQNRMGARFLDETLVWKASNGDSVQLLKYYDSIDKSYLLMMTKAAADAGSAAAEQKLKDF